MTPMASTEVLVANAMHHTKLATIRESELRIVMRRYLALIRALLSIRTKIAVQHWWQTMAIRSVQLMTRWSDTESRVKVQPITSHTGNSVAVRMALLKLTAVIIRTVGRF